MKTADSVRVQAQIGELVIAQNQLHQEEFKWVCANRARILAKASKGALPILEVGEYVMVARANKCGEMNKLASTWTGS